MRINAVGFAAILVVGVALGVVVARWGVNTAGVSKAASASASSSLGSKSKSKKVAGVEVATVESVFLSRGVSAVGTLRSENSVMLRPEVTGRISEINFVEGGRVKKGQVLVRLDDSVVKAQLQQAQANLSLAESQNRRAVELSKQGFISKQARDEAGSQLSVQRAAVALAKAQLGKTAIVAPFDSLVGLRNVSMGDYVSPGTDLVPIESIDPLQVDFRVPEQYLGLVHEGLKLTLSFDALPGQSREGVVGAVSPLVDVGGRSLLLRAKVANPDGILRPGMFTRVQMQFADDKALIAPETAFQPAGGTQYVYRVKDGHVERLTVQIGQRRSGNVEIISGLNAGDIVVVSGLQKISDGAAVRVLSSSAESTTP